MKAKISISPYILAPKPKRFSPTTSRNLLSFQSPTLKNIKHDTSLIPKELSSDNRNLKKYFSIHSKISGFKINEGRF